MIEGTFSIMNDNMDTETYDGIMNVKMHQLSTGKRSTKTFNRDDPRNSPIDKKVCGDLHNAAARGIKRKVLQPKNQNIHQRNKTIRMEMNGIREEGDAASTVSDTLCASSVA